MTYSAAGYSQRDFGCSAAWNGDTDSKDHCHIGPWTDCDLIQRQLRKTVLGMVETNWHARCTRESIKRINNAWFWFRRSHMAGDMASSARAIYV